MTEEEHAEELRMVRDQYEARLVQWREQHEMYQARHLEERDELRTDAEWWQRDLSRMTGLVLGWGVTTGMLGVQYESWPLCVISATEIIFSLYTLFRSFRRLYR